MNDQQFKELQLEIQKTMNTLETLQSIYLRQTGKRYVNGQRNVQPTVQADAKLKAVVEWLEQNQPDVFQRGLWDAIRTA